MGKVIAVANQKGGVGKSTTVINLAAFIGSRGRKVLCIDLDAQGNVTSGYGIRKKTVQYSSYDLLIGRAGIGEAVIATEFENVSIVPSTSALAGAEIEIADLDDRLKRLKMQILMCRDSYDYIFIDCPPSLNTLTVNAMVASSTVLVPIQCEYYALEGISQLIYTINLVRERLNPTLNIEGVVFTMFDSRTNLSQQVVNNVKENLSQYVFETIIPRNIRLAEAPSFGEPITEYDPRSIGAKSYADLAKELIKKNKNED